MKKTFVLMDEERGIVQVTTDDERFYIREGKDEVTGLPKHIYLPSCTWICGYAPKGIGFYKWLADKGWDESEAIKKERGKYGSRVHKAVEALLGGETVAMDTVFLNQESGLPEMLTFEEYDAILSFKSWWTALNEKHTVEVIEVEYTIWNEAEGFAGTIDLILNIDGVNWIIDLKTSQNVWLSHEIQVSAYKHSVELPDVHVAILQLGYKKNRNNYKFTEVEDKWTKFLAAREFWREEHDGAKPFQRDYPLSISLGMPAKEPGVKEVTKKRKSKK